ncbi:MAG: hypothetical protein ABEK04_00065, partial [Candidatus Nanohalobium sp.]
YRVTGSMDSKSTFRSTLTGVNATFTSTGSSSIRYNLSDGEISSLDIKIAPEIGEYGTKKLKIVTENLDTGIKQVHTLPVKVRADTNPTEKPVPGLGALQVLILLTSAALLYYRRF